MPHGEDVAECMICLEAFSGDTTKINIGVLISCGHYYHFECLWEWLRMRLSCPICRSKVKWSERKIRAVTYARYLADASNKTEISVVSNEDQNTNSVISVEGPEHSACTPYFISGVVQTLPEPQTEQKQHRLHRMQRTLSMQEALSNAALAGVHTIWMTILQLDCFRWVHIALFKMEKSYRLVFVIFRPL